MRRVSILTNEIGRQIESVKFRVRLDRDPSQCLDDDLSRRRPIQRDPQPVDGGIDTIDVSNTSVDTFVEAVDEPNVIIGASSGDTLNGRGGNDILIGGLVEFSGSTIVFDSIAELAALNAVYRQWIANAPFFARQAAIIASVGGPVLNASLVTSGAGATVINDNAVDVINGGKRHELDYRTAGRCCRNAGSPPARAIIANLRRPIGPAGQ